MHKVTFLFSGYFRMDPMNEVHVSPGSNLMSIAKGRSEEGDKNEQNFWYLQVKRLCNVNCIYLIFIVKCVDCILVFVQTWACTVCINY